MTQYSFQFPTDAAGKPGAAKPYREGNRDFVVPVASISGNSELLTNAVLKATEVYTQYGQDRLGQVLISKVKGHAYSDREGTLFIEESNDQNTWTTVSSLLVKAGTLGETEWIHLTQRYFRFRYANGNLQQSDFLLYQSLGAGEEDINIKQAVPIRTAAPLTMQIDKSGLTDDGRLKVQTEGLNISSLDTQAKTMDVVFHDKTETVGEGTPFTVGSFKTLLIEVYGTAETSELIFWGKSLSGTKRALRGQKVDDGTFATSTK
ncbi:phage portal protein, partial [Bacillus mycoides]|uniref:phage-like element PBSX protein XepA n=1 Tax=Bacillus mycoides TaxID=1405 RepID=UPI00366F1313